MLRAVLDINVLLSALIAFRGPSRHILVAWRAGRFVHCTSDHIINGLVRRAFAPDVLRRFPDLPAPTRELETILRTTAVLIPVVPEAILRVTGDAEDDTVLATARLAHADYLVTGDKGLQALGQYEGVRIITPRDFLARIEPGGSGTG